MRAQYDYLIVGAGTAGCVLAHRLSEDGRYSVALLEHGGDDRNWILQMPAGLRSAFRPSSKYNYWFKTTPQRHLNGRELDQPRGKALGGSSSINAMVYTRGQHEDYDNWDRFLGGNSGWGFKDLLPHFKSMECNHSFNDAWHGVGGPLHVSDTGTKCQITEDYVLAVQGLGIPYNPDFNGAQQRGVGTMQYTTWNKRRWNGVEAFLSELDGNPLFTVKTNFVVKQEGGYRSSKARLRIRCEDESFAIDYFIFYSETDGGGDSIGSSSDPYPKYDPIAPETVGAKIHDILCNANSESVPPG